MATAHITPASLRRHLKWFLVFRLLIVSSFLGTVAFLHLAAGGGRDTAINWMLAVIGATYVLTLASAARLKRTQRLELFACAQIAIDVLLTTGAVLLTGGADSPFPFLYCLTIINATALLQDRGAAVAALLASGTYTSLVLGLAFGVVSQPLATAAHHSPITLVPQLLTHNASFFLIAYLAGVLTRRLHDTTRLLEEEQQDHQRLIRLQDTLSRHIGCGLITTDVDGRITSANAVAAGLVGQDLQSLLESDIGAIFSPLRLTADARTAFLQSTSQAAATEFKNPTPDGTALLLRCSAAVLRDTYDHPFGALYVLQDVTVLRELEERYREEGEAVLAALPESAAEDEERWSAGGFIGRSPAILQVRRLIEKVAPSDATVLLQGDSGTGKEVVARAVHARSNRSNKPFVAIDCGAIPENLIESELFGHVKGAFTGAIANRPGFFRVADGGTVFLDEIGELPLPLQVKLLRVLQERVFKPVGGETHVAVDVRVIAATNRNLLDLVHAGRFREDLYYRLNVISIELPPLRERRGDIPLLIRHFLREFSTLHRKHVARLAVPAARRLLSHDYPGNVRELANIIEHAVTMCDGETVHEVHLPAHILEARRPPSSRAPRDPDPAPAAGLADGGGANGEAFSFANLDHYLAEHEKRMILKALEEAGGVKKRAAGLLGINYRSFRHRLSKYGLNGVTPGEEGAL